MRVAFTIIYNGYNHLLHNDYALRMVDMFDNWIIVEGAADNGGSTSWCHKNPGLCHSTDQTVSFLSGLANVHDNVHLIEINRKWKSKDEMVNAAINKLREITDKCTLWQVDIDEQWTLDKIEKNEAYLNYYEAGAGLVYFDRHFLGTDLIAKGFWVSKPVCRLWKWSGQLFASHEPSILDGQGLTVVCPEGIDHYSYYFDEDVRFKSQFYKGHESVYANWKRINENKDKIKFPIHISELFGKRSLGVTNTQIVRI
jgi:hypothetical protein